MKNAETTEPDRYAVAWAPPGGQTLWGVGKYPTLNEATEVIRFQRDRRGPAATIVVFPVGQPPKGYKVQF